MSGSSNFKSTPTLLMSERACQYYNDNKIPIILLYKYFKLIFIQLVFFVGDLS